MHELGIAEAILSAVRTEITSHPGARPIRVGLLIGEWASVDPSSLRFCFEAITLGTDWYPLALDIESTGSSDQLDFSYLELEETEPTANDDTHSNQNEGSEREPAHSR